MSLFFSPPEVRPSSLFTALRRRAGPSRRPIIQRGQSGANTSSRCDSKHRAVTRRADRWAAVNHPHAASSCDKLLLQQQQLNTAANQWLPPEESLGAPGLLTQRNMWESRTTGTKFLSRSGFVDVIFSILLYSLCLFLGFFFFYFHRASAKPSGTKCLLVTDAEGRTREEKEKKKKSHNGLFNGGTARGN